MAKTPDTTIVPEGVASAPGVESQEVTTQNPFVTFVDTRQEQFSNFSNLTYQLRDEEQAWRFSPTFEFLGNEVSGLLSEIALKRARNNVSFGSSRTSRRAHSQNLISLRDTVFSSGNQQKNMSLDERLRAFPQKVIGVTLTPNEQKRLEEWRGSVQEHYDGYTEARRAIKTPLVEIKGVLFSDFFDLLGTDSEIAQGFLDFLLDPKYGGKREEIRSFLTELANDESNAQRERRKSKIDEALGKREEMIKSGGPVREEDLDAYLNRSEYIPEYMGKYLRFEKSDNPVQEMFFGMEIYQKALEANGFSIPPQIMEEAQVNLDQYRKKIGLDHWPDMHRKGFQEFTMQRTRRVLTEIKTALKPYQREQRPTGGIVFDAASQLEPKKRKNRSISGIQQEEEAQTNETQQPKKAPIVVVKHLRDHAGSIVSAPIILTEEEGNEFITREAKKLAPNDKVIMEDVRLCIDNLRVDPVGLGTKQMNDRTLTVGQSKLPL